jgi:predicted dithiol-disulfide oxidoreductase (DUF899 family)
VAAAFTVGNGQARAIFSVATFEEHSMANNRKVVSHAEWLKQRKRLLVKEKKLLRLQDATSAERRNLPWVKVVKPYRFEGPNGDVPFSSLFDGRSQLIVYHFMFTSQNGAGCPHCSLRADGFNGVNVHLKQRDVTMVAVSRAPYKRLAAYQKRMGWTFPWFSSGDTDFNFDFNVSFTEEAIANGTTVFNYARQSPGHPEREGHSVFVADQRGTIYHTYSCYARGNEPFNIHYHYLDMVPKGRDEDGRGPYWVRRHDEYGT